MRKLSNCGVFATIRAQCSLTGICAPLTLHTICNKIVVQGGADMDTNMTFRIDSEIKAQMAIICEQLGMTQSTAFNIFANAFVRAKGMPFQ